MTMETETTLGFGEESETEYVERLGSMIEGDWQRVENAQAFQCDLGYGLCTIVLEKAGDDWIGKLSSINPRVNEVTKRYEDLSAAVLNLRVLIRDHGLMLKDRAEELIEIAADADESDGSR